ncbi:hypothetical protein DDE18_15305 [Nocardioides gansuensis]|uniref:GPI inositol-deacylase PGAP1-like alpha/beta domain-containing protein n=1 Tax=Nocardioides gansuensis TaxID=2138300 RepID=A0A2T8F8J5_9ACTN|nr:hypothetical protein [Nocardioides gansuensis]PVG82051.1 hypothetical protein DDE18_15305 [Nocardioides gansuensis]
MSSNTPLPPIQSVSGGSHGVEAGYDEMLALAARYQQKAGDFLEMAGLGAQVMADGDLLESAVLSPITFGDAELQVLDATAGPDGLTVRAVGIEADALAVTACVSAFRASDTFSRQLSEAVDHALGFGLGLFIRTNLVPLLAVAGVSYAAYTLMSDDQRAAVTRSMGQLLHDHPEVAEHLINSGGGLLEGLTLMPLGGLNTGDGPVDGATTNDAARLLALLFGNDSAYSVTAHDIDQSQHLTSTPTSLTDLLRSLNDTNELDAVKNEDGENHLNGAIQIQKIVDAQGDERHIVYIPGTDDMGPVPERDETTRDMLTNYQLIGGMDTAYGQGIADAMRDAGLSGKDVMLVGHSQGGMVSTSLAADPEFAREFHVRHVVTAGSPTAQVPEIPGGTRAIHFENRGDAVPLLDGEDNPNQPNRTTVTFDDGNNDVCGNHDIVHYIGGAQAADASSIGSIRDHVDQMGKDGFLGGGTVVSVDTYTISRT